MNWMKLDFRFLFDSFSIEIVGKQAASDTKKWKEERKVNENWNEKRKKCFPPYVTKNTTFIFALCFMSILCISSVDFETYEIGFSVFFTVYSENNFQPILNITVN